MPPFKCILIPYHLALNTYASQEGLDHTDQSSSNTYLSNYTILLYNLVNIGNPEIGNITRNRYLNKKGLLYTICLLLFFISFFYFLFFIFFEFFGLVGDLLLLIIEWHHCPVFICGYHFALGAVEADIPFLIRFRIWEA